MPARLSAVLLLVPILALLLNACGGAPASSPAAPQNADRGVAPAQPAKPAEPARAAEAARPAAAAPTSAPAAAAAPPGTGGAAQAPAAKPADAAAASTGRVAGAAGALPALDQKIIKTGKLDLIVASLAAAIDQITVVIAGVGGFTQQSSVKETTAEMILRVPVDQYEASFRELRKLAVPGTRIIESSDAQDVTEQFADTEARITNLKATEIQLLKLLAKAEKMEDIITVQREITAIREQIERLQGQLNVLSRRSAFSTIALTLRPQEEAKKPAPPPLNTPGVRATSVELRPTFVWTTSTGATAYELQVTDEVDTTFNKPFLTTEKLAATSYEWPEAQADLRQGATYLWRVRASNTIGESEWSPGRQFTTIPAWTPLRTAAESWDASLTLLRRLIDGTIRVVVFFWWMILLLALGFPLVRRLGRRRMVTVPVPPAPPAPPANSPPSA